MLCDTVCRPLCSNSPTASAQAHDLWSREEVQKGNRQFLQWKTMSAPAYKTESSVSYLARLSPVIRLGVGKTAILLPCASMPLCSVFSWQFCPSPEWRIYQYHRSAKDHCCLWFLGWTSIFYFASPGSPLYPTRGLTHGFNNLYTVKTQMVRLLMLLPLLSTAIEEGSRAKVLLFASMPTSASF